MANIDKIQVGDTTYNIAASSDATNTFTSGDVADGSATSWTTVAALVSEETTGNILNKISNMFKNIRYLYKNMLKYTIDFDGSGSTSLQATIQNDVTNNVANNEYAHAEGQLTTASGKRSHAEGKSTIASASDSHAEGYQTCAVGYQAHAEGIQTTAGVAGSQKYGYHAEGYGTQAIEEGAHAEGKNTNATKIYVLESCYYIMKSNYSSDIFYYFIIDEFPNENSTINYMNKFN